MILDDPQLFLHHVDFDQRIASFVKVSQDLLDARNAHNFDDIESVYSFDLDKLLEERNCDDLRPIHFLFMADFCGSTLLANALRALRGVSCLFEVRAFAGLAIRRRLLDRNMVACHTGAADIEDWQRVLRLTLFAMSKYGGEDTLIVKEWPPTNYIISDMLQCHDSIKAIFLYSGLEDYLNAIFRRPWRREFTRRRTVTELVETDLWPIVHDGKEFFSDGKIAAAHWFVQQQAFLCVDEVLYQRLRSLHSFEFYDHPIDTLVAVARHFDINVRATDIASAFASVSTTHSKRRDRPYSIASRKEELDLVDQRYHGEITAAVAQAKAWLDLYPIPQRLPQRL